MEGLTMSITLSLKTTLVTKYYQLAFESTLIDLTTNKRNISMLRLITAIISD